MHSISIVNIEDTAPILKKPDEPLAKHARVGDADKNKPGKFTDSGSVDMGIIMRETFLLRPRFIGGKSKNAQIISQNYDQILSKRSKIPSGTGC